MSYISFIFVYTNKHKMKVSNLITAENIRNNAFETTGTSLMIVMMTGYFYITSRKEATKLEKQGYEVF